MGTQSTWGSRLKHLQQQTSKMKAFVAVLALMGVSFAEPAAKAEAAPWYGYGGYYGKRSADAEPKAEADAWYGYGGLYGYGLPAYGGYGYGGYYGKRSADAEPKAEADAWYGYGGLYGYGL